jgi:hypothetical protein
MRDETSKSAEFWEPEPPPWWSAVDPATLRDPSEGDEVLREKMLERIRHSLTFCPASVKFENSIVEAGVDGEHQLYKYGDLRRVVIVWREPLPEDGVA